MLYSHGKKTEVVEIKCQIIDAVFTWQKDRSSLNKICN